MLTAQAQTALRCSIDVDQTRQVREGDGIIFNQHHDGDGEIVFEHACAPGCEGSCQSGSISPYRRGRSNHWLKVTRPMAPAVKREAEEDWS